MSEDEEEGLELIGRVIKLEEKQRMQKDIAALLKTTEQIKTNQKAIQLLIKDIPKKNPEDDPHYAPFGEYKDVVKDGYRF